MKYMGSTKRANADLMPHCAPAEDRRQLQDKRRDERPRTHPAHEASVMHPTVSDEQDSLIREHQVGLRC